MFKLFSYCTGILLLINLSINAKDYNGAELFTASAVKYGRYDVRMRAVSGSGIVSSFFLYYNDSYKGSPEPWEEIDVEVLGKDDEAFQSNIITGNAASKVTSEKMHKMGNLSKSYHTYTLEWTPDYIAWFFDGKEVRRTTGTQAKDCQLKDMSCRFNLWISDVPSWVGQFDPSILPVYQYINWVKYSKYTPGSGDGGTDFTPEWQDDFNSFNEDRWGKGNWTFDGNLVDFSTSNIVVKDGYCIICLTKTTAKGFSGDVPKDSETSIFNMNPDATLRINNNPNFQKSFSISLDGRLISRKTEFFNYPGLMISRENNIVSQKVKIAR